MKLLANCCNPGNIPKPPRNADSKPPMLTIHLIVVGEKMPNWVRQGYHEYAKRIHGRCALHLIEVAAERRGKHANAADLEKIAAREAARIERAIPKGSRVIALDRNGESHSTRQVSRRMEAWMRDGEQVSLLVGGAEGLSGQLLRDADETWSLSALTFAHPLVRVIVAEQMYRCYSLLENLPYHR